ncbi:MAG: hypothetical protein HN729_05725 [Candidatus Marinimicrobia bacterium]|jgi:hypothetical protein|nr:hypothetical protein [Candidatus Neomarinimicrobiota bacterium]MBT3634325.1 hypothetical protein [Candidatus Neomarinimicrobiota bacterium]MBT3681766.1 hypothetical protein [Candidatus Neomarinimicrobiota bacterium]MBT3759492.1 hypothetical protein [Candidatus Neomarinimicrobiota bacterium]MBT3895980.1 hypothetical protein [Candidatus Neomarinimicrobiota bacterium]
MDLNHKMISKITLYFLIIISSSALLAVESHLSVSQYIVSPRINFFNDSTVDHYEMGNDEIIHFRTDVEYSTTIRNNIELYTITEIGSKNYRNDDNFRVRAFYTKFTLPELQLKIGRQSVWNPYYHSLIDGVEIQTKALSKFSINFGGGLKTEFFDSSNDDQKLVYASGKTKTSFGDFTIHGWSIISDGDNHLKAGLIHKYKLNKQTRITTYGSWDFNHNLPYYNRIHINRYKGNHKIFAGFRQRIFSIDDIYPWIPDKKWSTLSIYIGTSSRLNSNSTINTKLVNRLSENSHWYFQSSFQYNTYSIMMMSGKYDDKSLIGGAVSGSFSAGESMRVGGNLSMNSLELDGDTELSDALGIYVWTEIKVSQNIKFKIFGQYYENSYYTVDGRGGVFISYDF